MALPSMFANMANGSEPQTSQKRVKTKSSVTTAEGMATLYVGNLPYKANEESIKSLFAAVGHVESVRLMKDRKTGRRKGFGFVEVEASKLDVFIDRLNDHEFMDRTIKVRTAKDKAS
ncbi:RNA-binding protein [Glaciecola sp. XM2]|nr:RNA-binding protein [Glaciecola sp. XM2]